MKFTTGFLFISPLSSLFTCLQSSHSKHICKQQTFLTFYPATAQRSSLHSRTLSLVACGVPARDLCYGVPRTAESAIVLTASKAPEEMELQHHYRGAVQRRQRRAAEDWGFKMCLIYQSCKRKPWKCPPPGACKPTEIGSVLAQGHWVCVCVCVCVCVHLVCIV